MEEDAQEPTLEELLASLTDADLATLSEIGVDDGSAGYAPSDMMLPAGETFDDSTYDLYDAGYDVSYDEWQNSDDVYDASFDDASYEDAGWAGIDVAPRTLTGAPSSVDAARWSAALSGAVDDSPEWVSAEPALRGNTLAWATPRALPGAWFGDALRAVLLVAACGGVWMYVLLEWRRSRRAARATRVGSVADDDDSAPKGGLAQPLLAGEMDGVESADVYRAWSLKAAAADAPPADGALKAFLKVHPGV